jgi:YidC/Oxa1 family membrane protein insertase
MSIWTELLNLLGDILAFFYGVIPSYGVAIILLTILVRLILYPLTAKQARSMIAMQRVQPEIKKLQAKYKNDRQKLNEEMMKFYKENKINPLGGCLPLVAQMPIFFALFNLLRHVQSHVPLDSPLFHDMCRAGAKTAKGCGKPNLPFIGMNLSLSASDSHSGFGSAFPYYVLIGLVVLTAFLQQKQTMRNQTQVNPQMQIIGKVMPLFFAFISLSLPAGLVLYFFVSNLWQMGQQELVFRTIGTADGPPGGKATTVDVEPSQPSSTGGGFLSRLLKPAAPPNGAGDGAKPALEGGSKDGDAAPKPPSKPASAGGSRNKPGQGRRRSNKKRRR